ncbi:MAG TPA: HEAT repeat domain-containing protein [Anaeromyxobacteraceae bacterium]|nr:HEAT repeat domain-containing protein [Anaeromyxobacteraceae bacterium]
MAGREGKLGELFRDLAVAGRAVASYPRGHPSTASGLAKAHATLSALLAETGPIELGAARDALLRGDERHASPTASQLARLLRRRRAAALFLEPGATVDELETLLRALAVDPRAAAESGPLSAELAAAGLVHVRVSDLDFSSLALVDGEVDPTAPEAGPLAQRIVRRLVAGGAIPVDARAAWLGAGRTDADLLQLLFATAGSDAALGGWGPAAFAVAVEVASEERRALLSADGPGRGGEEAPADPVATLADGRVATLRRAFAADDVDTLRDAGDPAATVAALLALPEEGEPPPLPAGAAAFRSELAAPTGERDPAPVLLDLAEHPEAPAAAAPAILARFDPALRRVLAAGRIRQATALVDRVQRRAGEPGDRAEAFRACAAAASGSEAVEALAAPLADLPDEAVAQAASLVQRLDPSAIRYLLDVLARTENRRARFRLLDVLARLGPAVARDAEALLGDPRWYVVRNMLLLLRRVGDNRSVPAVRRCVDHPDLRVRLEAIHNLFAFDRVAPSAHLRKALHDPDPRQAEAAMELVGKYGIAEAVGPIVEYLSAWDPLGKRRPVRLKAIRALAAIGDPGALAGLGRFRKRYDPFGPAVEERRELYRTLPAYPEDATRVWIVSGVRSRDPEIRRLAAAMGPGPGGTP